MYVGAKEVRTLPDFRLLIVFENGERRVFDVSPYLDHGVFQAPFFAWTMRCPNICWI